MSKKKIKWQGSVEWKPRNEWPQIKWWAGFKNAASKAKDKGFKEMWNRKARLLVKTVRLNREFDRLIELEKKRKNKTSPSNSHPI